MTTPTSFSLSIAHINDTHSHFESSPIALSLPNSDAHIYANCGGFARIATAVSQFRQQAEDAGREFLFLHAGDCFQGTLYYTLFKGRANADMLNHLSPDAMAIGNHELDQGNAPVADFLKRIEFPLLAGNWDVSNETPGKADSLKDKPRLLPYVPAQRRASAVIKNYGGHKVGIFSLAVDKMADIAHPDADTPFLPSKEIAINTVKYLNEQGVNIIILLSHLGYDKDLQLAEAVEGITLIIGGHTHVLQGDFTNVGLAESDSYAQKINDTLVVQAGCHSQAIGHLTLTFDESGNRVNYDGRNYLLLGRGFALDASRENPLAEDAYAKVKAYLNAQDNVLICKSDLKVKQQLMAEYRPAVEKMESDIVTRLPQSLRHVRIPDEKGGSEVAPLVTEAFLWASRKQGFDIDFAIHNAGGVRQSLNAGPLTAAKIAGSLLPFSIDVMAYKVTGSQVRSALESAINNATNNGVAGLGSGSFPYTAGLRFTYHCNQPQGKRITNLDVKVGSQWVPMKDDHWYRGVSSSYTSQGKEGYHALSHPDSELQTIGKTMSECFLDYAREIPMLVRADEELVNYIPCALNIDTA